jgi:polyhydroxybutyrate depolymerase
MSAGLERYYLLARPADTPTVGLPVVMVLHGRNMTPAAIEQRTGFQGVVSDALIVYPAGIDKSWNAGYCCGGAHRSGVDDVAFLEAVIRQVVASDSSAAAPPIYLVGYSNGGRMAYQMACSDPRAFSSVAVVEAVAVSACAGHHSVPLLEVVSTGDPLLSILSTSPPKHIAGHAETTVTSQVEHWRTLEGCSAASSSATYSKLQTTQWSSCPGNGRVAFAVYKGGSHAWPAGGPRTPSATELIWAFFHNSTLQVPKHPTN